MKPSKIFKRVQTVKVTVTFDTGETLNLDLNQDILMQAPGLDSIQTVDTVMGHHVGGLIEDWVEEHPVETELHRDVKSGLVTVDAHTYPISSNGQGVVELYMRTTWTRKSYVYDSYNDASDDLVYVRKYLQKNKK